MKYKIIVLDKYFQDIRAHFIKKLNHFLNFAFMALIWLTIVYLLMEKFLKNDVFFLYS